MIRLDRVSGGTNSEWETDRGERCAASRAFNGSSPTANLVGINYMIICRLYPDGGGVYASVRHRSEVISIVGAFLLVADYLVTAAISALSAFQYLGVPHPEKFAAAAILAIGLLNLLGPKQTGGLAFLVSVPTVIVVITLGLFALPDMSEAFGHLQPLHGGFGQNWFAFVGIVLALSGVEAIANATGVMKLDPGTTDENPVRPTHCPKGHEYTYENTYICVSKK